MGTNSGAPATDIDGDPRPLNGMTDIGADECTFECYLNAYELELSQSTGEDFTFLLSAGSSNAYRNYIILGSVTGNVPGINGDSAW